MPIRSIDDLRKQVGPDWNDVSDEDLISSYAKSIEANPAAVAHQLGFGLEEGGKNSKRLSSSVDRYQAGLYGVGEELTKAVGLDTASEWLGKQRRSNELRADTDSLRAQQLGAVDSFKDVKNLSDFGDYAVGLGIQSAPYLAEAALGGLAARATMGGTRAALEAATLAGDAAVAAKAKRALNIGSTAGATAASYPSSVGDILSNQREQAGQTDPLSAFALGVPYAAANAVGLEGAAARSSLFRNTINLLDDAKGLKGGLARAGATGVTTGLKEGASETFQEGMNQLGRMAVDPTESFLSDAAQERFKESFIGGAVLGGGTSAALGGWRRSQHTNDIQQVFQDTNTGTTAAPAVAQTVDPATVAPAPTAPVVVGGTTDVAQASQAAQAQDAVAEQAMQQQAAREQVYEQFGIADPQDPTKGQFFGQKLFGPTVRQVADAVVASTQQMTPIQQELARVVTFANAETGNQLVKFAFNAADPAKSVAKAFEAVGKVLTKFQIGHVQTAEEAGQILNTLSENAKGQQLEQINAMHVALTGEDTSGFLAVQNATTAKGAKNGKLQVQNPSGVGTVREQGGAGSPAQGNDGNVQPSGVQPVGAGSQPEGSLGLQVGQPAGEGVRPGSSAEPLAGDGSLAQAPQVTPTQELANEQGQTTPTQAVGAGQAAVQPAGADAAAAGIQEPAGNAAPAAAPAAAEVTDETEKLADQMESITDEVMKLLVKATSRMDEETAQKQRDFIFTLLVNGQYDSLTVMAADFGIKPHQAKDWSAKAKDIRENPKQLAAAYEAVAETRGLTVSELIARIEAKAATADQQAGTVVDESISTSREQGGPKDSDERKLSTQFDAEGKDEIGDREVTDEGLAVKGRKSGESLQERYNAVDTNQAKYLRLSEQLAAAEDAGDQAEIDRLNAELDAALAKGVEQAKKRTKSKSDAAPAEAPKRAPDSAETAAAVERWKAVKGDLAQLTDNELELIKARAEKFNNKKLTADTTAELSKRGGTDAVQKPSTAGVDVRQGASNGQAVGEGNAQGQAASESEAEAGREKRKKEVATIARANAQSAFADRNSFRDLQDAVDAHEENVIDTLSERDITDAGLVDYARTAFQQEVEKLRAEEVRTPQEQYETLTASYPVPAWTDLTGAQRDGIADLAHRDQLNLAALNTLLAKAPEDTASGKAIAKQVAALPAPQVARLESHYGKKADSAEFLEKVKEDVVRYATKGAAAVAAAIRDIIKAIHTGVLAVAMIFNPNVNPDRFMVDVPKVFEETRTEQAEVPAEAKAKMSDLAQQVYRNVAPAAQASGKGFMIADKPNGMMHVFYADGTVLAQEPALFGKDTGDKLGKSSLAGGPKITPAGKYTLTYVADNEYTGGHVFQLEETVDKGDNSMIAVHAAWLGDAKEQRAQRLESPSAADNRISYGCVNTSHDLFLNKLMPNSAKFNGGMIFILPDSQELTASMFPAKTTTVERTENNAKSKGETRTVVGKEESSFASRSKQFMEFDELADYIGGLDAVENTLAEAGISNAAQYVSEWVMVNDPGKNAYHGLLDVQYGQYVGHLNAAKLSNPSYAAEVALHEIGHAVDMAPHGGVYSSQPEMSVVVKSGKVTPVGAVARELYGLFQTNERWKNFLEYPFDVKIHKDLDNSTKVEAELFAQIFAIYVNPKARAEIERVAPVTAAYMKEVINDIKSAKPLQIQKATTTATRSLAFRNRSAGGSNQVAAQVPRQPAGRSEGFAARGKGFTPEEVIGALPKPLQDPVTAVTTNTWAGVKKAGLALAITEDVIKLAQKTMKSAADYLKAQYDQQATRLKFELQVEKILQQYDKLPKHVQGIGENSANRLIHDMTFEGKWGFVPSYNSNVTLDNAMVQRFNAMPASAQQLIRDVFEHGHNALVAKQDAVKAAADKVFAARIADAQGDKKELAEIALERKAFDEKFARILKIKDNKPYAYLGRYGNYVAVAKSTEFMEAEKLSANGDLDATKWLKENESNPDHYMVSFAETQAEADRMAADWKGSGKFGQTYASEKLDSSAYIGGGDLFLAFKRMENMITRKAKNELVGGTVLEGMRKLLADMYLASVAESSAHTSSLARKNISGADMDMMRNLATRGRADAHFLAALQHGDEVTDAMDRMIDERKDNPREAVPVLNELLKRQAQSMEYKLPGTLAQNLTQLSTVYYLSTSPAFYVQQLLQTAVLSLPFMAGRLGYFRSVRAIQQAYGDIRSLVKGLGVNEHVDFDKAPADVRAMLQTLVGMGKIDIGIDSDAKARSSDQGVMSKVMRKLQGVNTRVETINRATAAIAAYRGYLQKYGANKTAAATQYAADVVSNTHGSYDGFNTPRALSSDVGRVVGQFKRFQIIQLSMLGKLIHTAFKGASPEERMVARASLRFITSHMAVLGGALGVPFVSQLGNILVNIFGDDDEPKDLEQKLRDLIDNEAVATLLLRGVPASAGLESLGKKLAMENVASILPFTDVNLADRDALTKVYVSLLGPSAALTLKMADGLGMARKGDYYKGLEMLLPNGVSNVMKAGRFATEGVTMRNGDSVLGPDGISMVDAAFQAVGLPTSTITDRQRIQTVVAETDKFYEDRASQIKLDYTRAFKKGDSGAMQDAREEWMQLQDARSRNGYSRQPLSTLFRAPMQQAKRERNTAGGVEFNKNNRRFVESLSQ